MRLKKIINILYQILFFVVPLIFYPFTSELFEFNKLIVVYILAVLIALFWTLRCISERKTVFKRTILDIPIAIFLLSQLLSTVFSIDVRTSIFGYYDRFNGGLLSLLSFATLYWGFVSNLSENETYLSIKTILISTTLSSIYGILEHFGIDKNLWVQDVQNRVFSTFGQPNWLAAWLAATIPLAFAYTLKNTQDDIEKNKRSFNLNFKNILLYIFIGISFITLLFTKSRSGILGLFAADALFWGILFIFSFKNRKQLKLILKPLVIGHLILGLFIFTIGSPWTPNISQLFKNNSDRKESQAIADEAASTGGTALEVGGSSSIKIREIVWKGAIDVWKNYPIFGSGVESFAFSYYKFRPAAHNLVSEWDFLYNKAHNEYLNFMATTGSLGIISYCLMLFYIAYQIIVNKSILSQTKDFFKKGSRSDKTSSEEYEVSNYLYFPVAFLSGYVSILITNFFGFSVVPINILFYLFPAMAISLTIKSEDSDLFDLTKIKGLEKFALFTASAIALFLIYSISKYWYADVLYNRAHLLYKSGQLINATKTISSAIKLSPHEAIYQDELASDLAEIALVYKNQKEDASAKKFAAQAKSVEIFAESLSPANINILRNHARIAINLSTIDSSQILDAEAVLLKAINLAPTDAKLYYNLSMVYYRLGKNDKAIEILKKTIDLKANYRDAYYAYGLILAEEGKKDEAKAQINYILDNLSPDDTNALKELKILNSPAK